MKKIYFVLEHLGGQGGVETVLTTVSNELSSRGYEVAILLPQPSDHPAWEQDLPLVYYYDPHPSIPPMDFLRLVTNRTLGLVDLIRQIGVPDLLIGTHVPITTAYCRMAVGYSSATRVISWLHSPLNIFNNQESILYADAHWSIAKSFHPALHHYGIGEENITYLGNPVDTQVTPIPLSSTNHFIFIGRLENWSKRLDVIFHALAQITDEWTLDLYGQGPDAEMLVSLAQSLKLEQHIHFHGFTPNPWEHISSATALLLASDYEGFGLVLVEAMARGLPVITTDSSGPSEIVHHGENGFIVPKGNISAYAHAIRHLIHSSEEDKIALGQKGIFYAKNYHIQQVIDRLEQSL